ncbi:ATP-binding protein [Geosporobacter ferrireducens]|uniref:Helicase HerA central domain-containing protein n=1 Tax=Geosporobacter ferrireducens TaxID=1424294 RepID=A0A1D8GBP2_9FIRM|nr:DUF87 domain-containing protein [Geosporobacter ferrireducens]AOT68328.1 hypothetical protein Gferi_01210 [Geosporobacter ferrireducens]
MDINSMVTTSATQDNPINILRTFIGEQDRFESAMKTDEWRFVGYVLELGFDSAKIITSDPYKIAVGGIPRGSFLIMVPMDFDKITPHFTLLRVTDVATTPLSSQVQQTYFELHKKSMPEIDIWTQSELQWGALDCDVLGMFYPDPEHMDKLFFSGDVNNVVSAHKYRIFSPNDKLLNLIINSLVRKENKASIGNLRTMECKLSLSSKSLSKIPVEVSMRDFMGCRTAMFGKTRLGKSNVVKLIMQGMLDSTETEKNIGQLVFDINGEYANDNEQDNNFSIRSANEERCVVYALTKRAETPSEPLRLNFYEYPDQCMGILASMLDQDGKKSIYITSFANAVIPSIKEVLETDFNTRTRPIRKIQMYWAILKKAGFSTDEASLKKLGLVSKYTKHFDPHFNEKLRRAIYNIGKEDDLPQTPSTLDELVKELECMSDYVQNNSTSGLLSNNGKAMFDPDDLALLKFLKPSAGSAGPTMLRSYIKYHSSAAGDFIKDILTLLDEGKTVILDLGNASDEIRRYFSEILAKAVFAHQEQKFVSNTLKNHYVELYFEEAHNLFPPNDNDLTGVYARFAKEGAKFHIGMVYSTQSPSTINKELLIQTENFFVGHLSSQDEVKALSKLQIAFSGIEDDILRAKTPGYMRMLTLSHRFVVPMQAYLFQPKKKGEN